MFDSGHGSGAKNWISGVKNLTLTAAADVAAAARMMISRLATESYFQRPLNVMQQCMLLQKGLPCLFDKTTVGGSEVGG